tara:strand:+ start:1562 stop:2035 length:474 start_codon:yes stop_codon:yes gene_type:complete
MSKRKRDYYMMNRKDTSLLVESWRKFINESSQDEIGKLDPETIFDKIKEKVLKKVGNSPATLSMINDYRCFLATPSFEPLYDLENGEYAYNNDGQDRGLYFKLNDELYTIPFSKVDTDLYLRSGTDVNKKDAPIVKFEEVLVKEMEFKQRDGLGHMR